MGTTTTTSLMITSGGSAAGTITGGTVVALTATVTAGATPVKVGQINFCDAAAKYCTDVHLLGMAQLTQAGNATFRFRPSAGTHSYYAVFVGTNSYAASASGTEKLMVTETGLLPAAAGVAQSGSPGSYTLTASVGGRGNTAPTGTVSFLDTSNGSAVLGTATLSSGAAGPGFLNSSYSSIGLPLLWDIAVGDFNADGIPDVAFVGFNENTLAGALTVLLGNGDGTFRVSTSLAMPNEPISIAVGDFNGDGKTDLAIGNWGNSTVSILLGSGDGTFTASTSGPVTVSNPGSMTMGDFNGDGVLDLAVANDDDDSVSILLGNGDGTFAMAPTIAGISGNLNGLSVAQGDFNQDGITDLVVASQGDGVSPSTVKVLLGKGDGTFTPMAASPSVGVEVLSIAVADLNGDGIPDLAVPDAAGYYNNVTVLLGNGDGTFTATVSPTTGKCPRAIVVGDFNGDGIPDLATGGFNPGVVAGTVMVLLGNGDGTFTAMASPTTGVQPYSIAAGDFNGDGISDLAIANFNIPSSVSVLLTETQTATATVTGITLPVATGTHLVVAKYSGDKIYSAATSGATGLATGTSTPTVALAPSANPATYGTSLTLTTTVSGVGDTPTGNVTFLDGSTPLGTGTLVAGIATFSSGALAVGSHSITVSYGGDGNYNPASSSVLNITVNPGTPAVSLTSSGTPAPYGTTVTFTASVTGGGAVPTGTLAFFDGATQLGISQLRLGIASYTTSVLEAGPHSISASYGGDTNYTAQASSILVQTMVPATNTTLTITSAGHPTTSIAAGSPVTLTASVQLGGALVTTGTVNFCNASAAHCTDVHMLGTAQLTSAGTATINLRPGIGGHSFMAVFVGTNSAGTSTSVAVPLAVSGLHPTTAAIAESGSVGNYTLTATVDGIGPVAPTGTVSFLDTSDNNAVLGSATLGAVSTGLSLSDASNPIDSSSPASIAVGDFNGDGIPDFAVANFGANNVTVFLGDGTGNFTATANPQAGNGPIAIAAGDFNGDGILDLAVGNYSDSTITILLGDGKGNFASTASPIATGVNPDGIAISDLNNDGNLDLAVANYGSSTVTLLLGDGKGDFTVAAASPATGANPASIAVADFNGDGIPDLATANSNDNTVTVLLGKGDGTFAAAPASPTTGNSPNSIVAGDFNNDGKTDLAVANFKGKSVTVLLGNGNGTFTTESSPATGNNPYSVVVADFNGDGIADLATANYNDNTVTVLLGDGIGNFTATPTSPQTGNYPVSLTVGDFNGDGWHDLVVANYHDTTITVLLTKITQVATANASGIALLGAGTHQVAANYLGDSNYDPSISGTVGLTGQLLPPRMTLVASATTSTAGTPVTLTATVSGSTASPNSSGPRKIRALASTSNPAPTGTVTFLNGSAALGTSPVNSNGVAAYTTNSLAAGKNTVSASYAGDANYSPMTSSAVVISVSGTITPALTVAPSTSSITTAQVLTVTVVVNGGPGNPTATGTITLAGGAYASAATVLSSGSATINIPAGKLAIGADVLTVAYTPDSSSSSIYNDATGTSPTVSVTQAKMTPTVTVSPSGTSITTAQALAVTVTINGGTGNLTPTGSVTLTGGGYTSGATALSSGSTTINIPAGSLAMGSDTLTATYAGDSNFNSATSTASVNVSPPPSFTLAGSPTAVSMAQGGSGTSTITVTTAGGFSDNVALSATGLPSGVTASFVTGSMAATQVLTLTASISAQVTSSPVSVTITGTSGSLTATTDIALTITAQPSFIAGSGGTTSMTLSPGATTGNTGAISVLGANGFSGSVALTCRVTTSIANANDMPTCSLNPTSVTISGTTAQTSTLTVSTRAATSAENQLKKILWPSAGGVALASLVFFAVPRRRSWLGMLGVLALLISLGTLGCGGGGSIQGGGGGGNSGTTPGSYSITVTGTSGAISATVGTVALTVQ